MLSYGAETDKRLGIAGEDLPGSHTATEFVGWYNAHPDYRDRVFDFSCEVAVVIGQGNVAMDVSRILSKTVDELRQTDIADYALEALSQSKIREVHLVGRRGPAQAKFTPPEIREIGELVDCDPVVKPEDLVLNPESEAEIADPANRQARDNYEILKEFAARGAPTKRRRYYVRNFEGPKEIHGNGRVERIVLEKNVLTGRAFEQSAKGTGATVEVECGLVFRSIGYHGIAMPGVPFDKRAGVIPNEAGRVISDGAPVRGVYVAGWIKRGPTGVIGTTSRTATRRPSRCSPTPHGSSPVRRRIPPRSSSCCAGAAYAPSRSPTSARSTRSRSSAASEWASPARSSRGSTRCLRFSRMVGTADRVAAG